MSHSLEVIVVVLLAMGAAAFVVVLYDLVTIEIAPGEASAYALTPNGTPMCTTTRLPVRLPSAPSARRLVGDLDRHGSR